MNKKDPERDRATQEEEEEEEEESLFKADAGGTFLALCLPESAFVPVCATHLYIFTRIWRGRKGVWGGGGGAEEDKDLLISYT